MRACARYATWETEQKCVQDYGPVLSCFAVMGASPDAGPGGAVAAAACAGMPPRLLLDTECFEVSGLFVLRVAHAAFQAQSL
jgi:hypothetical protein